jgi:PAS domain S-box-containing protein
MTGPLKPRRGESGLSAHVARLGLVFNPPASPAGSARYRQLLALIDEAVLVVDASTGTILEASAHACTLTGLPAERLIGQHLSTLLAHPAITHQVGELARLAPGMSQSMRGIVLSVGRQPVVDARFSVVAEEGGRRRLLVVFDEAAELRRVQATLIQQERLLAALGLLAARAHDPSDDMLFGAVEAAVELLHAPAGALYLVQNDMLKRIAECGASEELPATLTPDGLPGQGALDILPLAAGDALLVCLPPAGPEPLASYLSAEPLRAAVAGCLTAVVAAWQARGQTASAAARFRQLSQVQQKVLAHVTSGVIVLDAGGHIVVANPAAAHLLGYEPAEVHGLPYGDVLVARVPISDWVEPALAGEPGDAAELVLIGRTGQELPGRLFAQPLVAATGATAGALLVIDDLSEHKEKDDRLRELDRLQFLAEVSPVLAHEIRNPLAAIQAGVQYIAAKLPADHPLQETVTLILAEGSRLNLLFTDFLAAARTAEPRLMPYALPDLLAGLIERRTAELQRRGIEVHRQFPPDLPPALVDPARLEQVFINLIDNALAAIGQDGLLTVGCRLDESDGTPRVQVTIGDNGPGIAPELLERIWQPFYTTKTGGTGLGLPISRRIVNAHNGMLTVESFPGIGTIFTVALPVAPH